VSGIVVVATAVAAPATMDFDLIVRNGIVVTASDIWYDCDIGIKV
jgi:hypothetical protein